ncbi:MAG: carbamoyltransferase HypF [Myxococcota bacterium]|nr:carbamoyltransferase HypF [Myxococcota bacterium]
MRRGDAPIARVAVRARGAVQGVGLRPWVHQAALSLSLAGFVRNTSEGIAIEAEGPVERLDRLVDAVRAAPRPAIVEEIEARRIDPRGDHGFRIETSEPGPTGRFPLLPDLATCEACRREVLDPKNRRFRHPFASCTRCGPRYSIAESLPWDRARTSMAGFTPCVRCSREYDDPTEARRFHAQTLACPDCGPRLALLDPTGRASAHDDDALERAAKMLRTGAIVALKGLGGFQLLVNARDESAVRRLRKRKGRPSKPLALVVAGLPEAQALVGLGPHERSAFASPAGPIVLAERRDDADVAASVAPGVGWLGVMRATTPLHLLLLESVGAPLVATSGNRSGEPLCARDDHALEVLGDVADAFLTHDRPILHPVDDSVVREIAGRVVTLRCARGFAPLVLPRRTCGRSRIALGGDLKAAPAVAAGDVILLGAHVGDLESPRAADALEAHARALASLGGAGAGNSEIRADAHPDGHVRHVAARMQDAGCEETSTGAVFHHQAHVLAGWTEHGGPLPVLGLALDGNGFGPDRSVWGGELLHVDLRGFERMAHLRRFRLPGGDAAAREPRRAALGLLHARFGAAALERRDPTLLAFEPHERRTLLRVLEAGRLAPETSSAGRLFDAVASLLGVRQRCEYEAQAALELESLAAADPGERAYPMDCRDGEIDWGPLLDALLADREAGVAPGIVVTRFHRGLAGGLVEAASRAANETGTRRVVLTGGCFQNALLARETAAALERAGLEPLLHERVPPGDGGLAVGQLQAGALAPREGG